jgi:hypothetical protein
MNRTVSFESSIIGLVTNLHFPLISVRSSKRLTRQWRQWLGLQRRFWLSGQESDGNWTLTAHPWLNWPKKFSQSKSKSHYDQRSVSQYVLVLSRIWDFWPETFFFVFCFSKVTVLSLWGVLSDERSGLSFVSLCQYSLQWSVSIYINRLH